MSQTLGVGTPPTSRRVSPAPRRRSSSEQRNSVVPFRRSTSSSRLDTQSNPLDRSFRPSAPSQFQSQSPVVKQQSFPTYSLDGRLLHRERSRTSFVAPNKPADSPFRQEGFATAFPDDIAERDSQAVLASAPESPDRTKSRGLLTQQLSSQASSGLTPADVKVFIAQASCPKLTHTLLC